MRLRSSLTRRLGLGLRRGVALLPRTPAMVFLLAAAATAAAMGGGGCGDETVATCDATMEGCEACGADGCHPSGAGGGGGQGGSGGGQGACDPEVALCPCDENAACPEGTQCLDGLCLEGCDYSYECGAGKVCANGECVLGCDTQHPCPEAGTTCVNGICVPDPQNPACDAQHPCPIAGDICVDGVCATGCDTNSDCPEDQVCNSTTGACMVDPSPDPGCASSESCGGASQVCGTDGYCHYTCTLLTECKLVDNRFVACDQGICKTDEEHDPECTLENPCPAGQDCISNHCL